MAKEIERKYLLANADWRSASVGVPYRQGYLSTVKERTVRVRTVGERGFLTIKGVSVGVTRSEYEYEIPAEEENAMLDELCERPLIEKNRYTIAYEGLTWEVDEFFGENAGLIVAEVELADEDQAITLPPWVGVEVSGDARYFNSSLIKNPYLRWKP